MKWFTVVIISAVVFLLVFWLTTEYLKKKEKSGKGAGEKSSSDADNSCTTRPPQKDGMKYDCLNGNWVGTPTGDPESGQPFLKSSNAFMNAMCSSSDPNCIYN